MSAVRFRAVSPVADSSRAGTLGERLGAHGVEHLERRSQLLAGIDPAVLPTQPLAIQQVGAGEMDGHTAALEPFDRLAVEGVGGLAVTQQRT